MKIVNLEEILNRFNLHTYYRAGGNPKGEMLHDIDCKFCGYESEVIEAMRQACNQTIDLCAENATFTNKLVTTETINGDIYSMFMPELNEQSILDTKKQII